MPENTFQCHPQRPWCLFDDIGITINLSKKGNLTLAKIGSYESLGLNKANAIGNLVLKMANDKKLFSINEESSLPFRISYNCKKCSYIYEMDFDIFDDLHRFLYNKEKIYCPFCEKVMKPDI